MTPLWGTKHSSAPVGDKSDGDRRAARSLLSCALWSGMGRLWRGMGGMGRPEPLSAHHPHRQQRLSGFHETRDPRHGYCQARGASQREFRGFHETRITRHESRLFFETRLLRPFGSPWVREGWRHKKLPSGPLLPPASRCFPVRHCSPLFTIVHYCSPLFTKKYCPAPVPSCRPVVAFLRVVARHGAAMARHGAPRAAVRAPSAPAT